MKIITNLTSKEHMSFDIAIVTDSTRTQDDIKISRIKRLNSDKLFTNVKEVMIDHEDETYFLRITKQNKLILTK
ncbi:MAG: hemin uptake protein HemP [Methylotenera sp.]|jgi:hemin uptake protein HemP|uniref:Hemin uptake protein HemP n=2 Tax=Methylophilaceae TaxID=32011 RepID=A0A351R812_9PROT|nr:hemin uptake protein HemP [Methylotenera sp. L2L1]MDP3777603.1 hemin uptake protein HemP [Methylotenera sp.]HBA08183.1 hemin uptake protein HemP [Methylotenera mobilis]PPC96318.1 MAG: hemin uptake protein HemP [Methylotenera sp.]PPC98459.1 MAG: hemin uptake protein HemP [Methylotenera sp.]PPD43990.1 MAG: hemin uptake protein HemP [Methylotenera sp.]